MAVKLLQVLVLGVIAAAAEDADFAAVSLPIDGGGSGALLVASCGRLGEAYVQQWMSIWADDDEANEDVPVTWLPSRGLLQCRVPGAERIPARRPPPPLNDDQPRAKPYVWERGGEEVKNRVSNNGSLEVSRRKDPEGLYQCSTKFQGGKVLGYPVNLKFGYLEKLFSVQPANATAWRGQPYALTCSIASEPPAVISWIRNSKPLPADSRYIVLKNQLLIAEVTDEDAGLYRCRATNPQIGKSRTSHGGRLAVEDGPADLETAFLPVDQETSIAAPMGSRVVLACPVVGERRPKLFWELTVPGERTAELEFESENLVWENLQPDQEGVHSCRVHGHSHLVKTFNVTMTERVLIKHPPESKQVVRASTVRFNCSASGRPAPTVTWYKDGVPLQLTRRIDILPNIDDKSLLQLLIRGVTSEDAGIYQCFASNSVSMASAWGVLNVTGAEAGAPKDLRCWPVGAYDVVLEWTKVPHTVIAYTVHTTVPEGDSFPEQPVTSTNTTIKVKSPLTSYGFQVRAYIRSQTGKKNGASDMSETIVCQGQGVPIKLTKLDDDNGILISWQQFFEENPGVVQWILQHRVENGTEERNVTLDGKIYNYTLKVSPLESIQVRVLGTRTVPWPQQNLTRVPWTSSADARHQLGPGEMIPTPINVEVTDVNAQNFTVRWQCEQDNRYAYLVCVRKVGGNEECWDSYLTSVKVSHLQADTAYEVRVQAKLMGKAVGGDFSAVVMASTPSEEDVEYSYTSDGVEVRWRGAGPRSVHYTQNITQPMELWRVLNTTTQTRVQITGLDPKLSTYVMVAAPGPDQRRPVHTIKPPPAQPASNLYLYISISLAILVLCLLAAAAACVWHRRKARARGRRAPVEGTEEEGPKQKNVGGRLANGGGSRDAGEPLLNGHVHITENPSQSKTPNGKVRKGQRYEAPFDVARYDGGDVTLETVLDDSASTTLSLFDTSRRPDFDRLPPDRVTPNASFNKLPDDNMNSEVTRSTFELDTSQRPPTLQPNG